MIIDIIKLDNWEIEILIAEKKHYNITEILEHLLKIGCTLEYAKLIYNNLITNDTNIGFTYSNYFLQKSIIFIGILDSPEQLINTITHESRHIQQHISNYLQLDENSEEVCYLLGSIVSKIYSLLKDNNLI